MALGFVKSGRVRLLAAAVVVVVVVGAVLFGVLGGGGSSNPTDGGTATPTSTPTIEPQPQPTIEGNTFYYPGHGYAALIPEGWHANPGGIVVGSLKIDTFFSSPTVDGVQANVSVTCEEHPGQTTTDQYVQTRLETLTKRAATDMKKLGPVNIDGVQAQLVSYTIARDQITVREYDAMFVTPACGWTIALATAPSAENANRDVFTKFLDSFRLIDTGAVSGTPTP